MAHLGNNSAKTWKVMAAMSLDAKNLRDFYRTGLGNTVRRQIVSHIRGRWKSLHGETLIGAGFAAPYLGSFRSEVGRLGCLMPARQGAKIYGVDVRKEAADITKAIIDKEGGTCVTRAVDMTNSKDVKAAVDDCL